MKKDSQTQHNLQKGFTLVELLIVIGLVGVLAAALITVFDPIAQIKKSKDAVRKSDLSQIQRGLELYYQDTGSYPPSSSDYRITKNGSPVAWGSSWAPYMVKLPADPTATKKYIYYTPAGGQTYYIYANLDRGVADTQSCTGGNNCPNVPSANACGAACNFGVSSPNTTP